MKRRELLVLAGAASFGVQAQVLDVNDAINKILASGVLQARFGPLAIVIPGPQEPGSAEKYMAKDRAMWEPLVRSLNISLD